MQGGEADVAPEEAAPPAAAEAGAAKKDRSKLWHDFKMSVLEGKTPLPIGWSEHAVAASLAAQMGFTDADEWGHVGAYCPCARAGTGQGEAHSGGGGALAGGGGDDVHAVTVCAWEPVCVVLVLRF